MTVFCYENAAFTPARRNLAAVRAGEYEGLTDKLARPNGSPTSARRSSTRAPAPPRSARATS